MSCSERSGSNSAWQNSQLSAAERLVNDFSPDFNKVTLPLIKLPKNWLSTFLMENSTGNGCPPFNFCLCSRPKNSKRLVQGQHISHRHLVLLQQRSNAGGMTTHLAGEWKFMAPSPDTVSCSCWQNQKNKTLWHLNAGIQQIAIAWAFIHLLGNLCCNVHRALLDRLERVLGCWMFRVPCPELRFTCSKTSIHPKKNASKSTPLWCQDLVEHEFEPLDASKDVHHRHFDMDSCQAWPCPAPDPERNFHKVHQRQAQTECTKMKS